MNAHPRQSHKQIKLDRVISAFLDKKTVHPSDRSLDFGVRVSGDGTTAILEWHGTMYHRRWHLMDLAEWANNVLTIPGPPEANRDQEVAWSVLVDDELWGDEVSDMIAYLLAKAVVKVHGEQEGKEIWDRVKEALPHKADSGGMTWAFATRNASVGLPWFPWPFVCDITDLAIVAPPPRQIVHLFGYLKTRGAAAFLATKLKAAYRNIHISKRTQLKLSKKIMQDRLDEARSPGL
jgi:hypothetical protein